MTLLNCEVPINSRKRVFWATQLCKTESICGSDCGVFGLALAVASACGDGCDNTLEAACHNNIPPHEIPRSIANNAWVQGLLLNILLTDGVTPESSCGFPAGTRGGYWADSYRSDGLTTGSNIRAVPAGKSVNANIQNIKVEAELAASKLVSYGVASSATADVTYAGNSTYKLIITFTGTDGASNRVGLTGARLANELVWSTGL